MLKTLADKQWDYIVNCLFCEKTNLIYDFRVSFEKDGCISDLPTPEEIHLNIPNACGWGTGMEDSVLNAGTFMEAIIARYDITGDKSLSDIAHKIYKGMELCASVSDKKGFVARSVSPVDNSSHYINSSRDQYTHFVYAAYKYYHSDLCCNADRQSIVQIITDNAELCIKEVVKPNNYTLLREDGHPAIACEMWGDINPHEYLRLPMIYLAAYDITENQKYYDLYMQYRDKALKETAKVSEDCWAAYILLQVQYSLRLVYEIDKDSSFNNECLLLMKRMAELSTRFCEGAYEKFTAPNITHKLNTPYLPWRDCPLDYQYKEPKEDRAYFVPRNVENSRLAFYPIRNVGEALIVQALCPDTISDEAQRAVLRAVMTAINCDGHMTYAPLLTLDAYWLLRQKGEI